ncbi:MULTISPECIES: hypothetical protein [unclassified Microbacterium]|uniref:hypothetical protein n=1 Tax=unclassified Microbacterium TaxID=2609290 RepID=UPI00301A0081|nr:hypothetical protein [Actinomycetota bacterium]
MADEGEAAANAARRARNRETQRRWELENPDRVRASHRRWREANAEHVRAYANEYNASNRARVNERERLAAQRRRDAAKKAAERREKDRQRAREWAAANPERLKERRDRWQAANRDKVLKAGRDYYQRNKEEILSKQRERAARDRKDPLKARAQRDYVAQNKDRILAQQRARRSTPEGRLAVNRDNRERKRRERRRQELGLPPRPRHRWTKNERAEHVEQSSAFFARPVTACRMRELWREAQDIAAAVAARDRREEEQFETRWRLIEIEVDMITRALPHHADRILQLPHGKRLREEVTLDSVARQTRGGAPFDIDAETRHRAMELAIPAVRREARLRVRQARDSPGGHISSHRLKRAQNSEITARIEGVSATLRGASNAAEQFAQEANAVRSSSTDHAPQTSEAHQIEQKEAPPSASTRRRGPHL